MGNECVVFVIWLVYTKYVIQIRNREMLRIGIAAEII